MCKKSTNKDIKQKILYEREVISMKIFLVVTDIGQSIRNSIHDCDTDKEKALEYAKQLNIMSDSEDHFEIGRASCRERV